MPPERSSLARHSSLLAAVARHRQGRLPTGGRALRCCSWHRDGSPHAISVHDMHRAPVQSSLAEVASGESGLTGAATIARLPVHPPRVSGSRGSTDSRTEPHSMVDSDRCLQRCKGIR